MKEEVIQQQVADYLVSQYSDVLFHSDFGSGVKLTLGQAAKQKRLNGGRRAWPDMFIAEPQFKVIRINDPDLATRHYHGLFIELKKDGETLYPGPRAKKRFKSIDGKEYKNEHLMEQADVLFKLRKAGYAAEFAIGFNEAIGIIDDYLRPRRW